MIQILNEHLNRALYSRIVIEQANGALHERTGLDMEQAFSGLRNHARNHNLRLVDVAWDVIPGALATGTLDPFGGPPGSDSAQRLRRINDALASGLVGPPRLIRQSNRRNGVAARPNHFNREGYQRIPELMVGP